MLLNNGCLCTGILLVACVYTKGQSTEDLHWDTLDGTGRIGASGANNKKHGGMWSCNRGRSSFYPWAAYFVVDYENCYNNRVEWYGGHDGCTVCQWSILGNIACSLEWVFYKTKRVQVQLPAGESFGILTSMSLKET